MYGGSTPKFKAPYLTYGDTLSEVDQKAQAYIFENALYGAVKANSGGHGVVREGDYEFSSEAGGTFRVTLKKNDITNSPALEAWIRQVAVYEPGSFYWGELQDNTDYYLYVELLESGSESSLQNAQFMPTSSLSGIIPTNALILATVSIVSGVGTITTSPTGKIRIPRLDEHIADNTDPHGSSLYQTMLACSGLDVAESGIFQGPVLFHGSEIHRGPQTFLSTVQFGGAVNYDDTVHFRMNVTMDPGITLDGVDVSTLSQFFDGSAVGAAHLHTAMNAPVERIMMSPLYANSLISGTNAAILYTQPVIKDGRNALRVIGNSTSLPVAQRPNFTRVILRVMVPDDFASWSGVQFDNQIDYPSVPAGTYVGIKIFDTLGNSVKDVRPLQSTAWQTTLFTIPAGTFTPGQFFEVHIDLKADNNLFAAYAGDISLLYNPAN